MAHTAHLGTPCWVELHSTDPVASAAFYSAVLGWRCQDKGPDFGHYRTCWSDEDEVAGILGSAAQQASAWTVYLAVDDAAATVAAVLAAGGEALGEVQQVGDLGHMALVRDPFGAMVGLWQAGSFSGFTAVGSHGAPAWFEVNTRSGDALSAFLAQHFGLERRKQAGKRYWTLHADGRACHGVLQMNEQWEGMAPHWMTYFSVDDLDPACQRVRDAGGTVDYAPFDTPFGRIAICTDPLGAAFTLVTPPASAD